MPQTTGTILFSSKSGSFVLKNLFIVVGIMLSCNLLAAEASPSESGVTALENYLNLKKVAFKQSIKSLKPKSRKSTKFKRNSEKSYLVIIIDDIGNNLEQGKDAVNLPGEVTFAILPHTPGSTQLAELAYKNGKEIMLHAPMESLNHNRLGKGALTKDMSKEDFLKMLRSNIDAVPHLKGINNHMGSLLTQEAHIMSWLMEEIAGSGLYFVDSRTTAASVASQYAYDHDVKHLTRDIFLDNEQNESYIDRAFKKAIRISKKTGSSIAIGHPYPSTVKYLNSAIPTLEEHNVELIRVSKLMAMHYGKLEANNKKENQTLSFNQP